MGNSWRLVGSYCLLVCVLYSLFPGQVEAARKVPVVRPASAEDNFVKGVGTANEKTLDINRHWGEVIDVKPGTTTLPVTQKSKYNWPRFKGILKNAVKLHPGRYLATAAGTALLAAMPDATWDGFKLQRKGESQPIDYDPQFVYWDAYGYRAADPSSAISKFLAATGGGVLCGNNGAQTEWSVNRFIARPGDTCESSGFTVSASRTGSNCPSGSVLITGVCYSEGESVPFADADYDQFANGADGLSDQHISDLGEMTYQDIPGSYDYPDGETFDGPPSYQGQPTQTTTTRTNPDGSTSVDLSETTTNYNFDYGTNPLTITTTTTTVTNNYSNGTLTSTTTTTDASPNPETQPEVKEKIDCEFMPTHCAWLEWTKQAPENLEEEQMPWEEVEQPAAMTIGPSGVCPPPVIIDGQGIEGFRPVEFKFDPICDFFEIMRPIVLAVCSIFGTFILAWRYN